LLEIAHPSGKELHLELPLRYPEHEQPNTRVRYTCRAYADQKSELVAVGIGRDTLTSHYQLQVAVANLESGAWIGDWEVGPISGIHSPILAGFLNGTSSLAVTGVAARPTPNGEGLQHGKFMTMTFGSTGRLLTPVPETRSYSSDSDIFPTYADSVHNRLWVFHCVAVSARMERQPVCPITSTTLTGDESPAVEFDPTSLGRKRADLWFDATSFVAPTADSIMFAEYGGRGAILWRVNVGVQSADPLVMPSRHFPSIMLHPAMVSAGASAAVQSPDGEVVAVPLPHGVLAFPYLTDDYVYKGTDVAVVRVEPLQLLAVVQHEHRSDPIAFAVDHRQGRVTVLVRRNDGWERTELRPPKVAKSPER
jgi:hypothetical protein